MGIITNEMEREFNESNGEIDDFMLENSEKFDSNDLAAYVNSLVKQVNERRSSQGLDKLKECEISDYGDLTNSTVYSMFNGSRRNPTRDTVIKFCFGLGVTCGEANGLLRKCGKGELYIRNERDCIILFYLKQFEHKAAEARLLTECNIKLTSYGLSNL